MPGGKVQFLERPATANGNGAPASNGETTAPAAAEPSQPDDDLPF